jgi:AcrR family transcriptional regulator
MSTPEVAERKRWAPGVRRAQLLTVAEEVFTRLGYQGTAVEDIATAAGVTRTLVYKYFPDKDAIYLECIRSARAELEESFIAAAGEHATAEAQLRAGLGAYFAFVRDRGQRWDMLFGGGSAVAGNVADEVAELRYDTAEKIAVLVTAAAPQLEAEAASAYAHAISGTAEQLARWSRRQRAMGAEELVQLAMDALWVGLQRMTSTTDGPPSR